ncbi:MAG TPA: MotA/TolQ/ExbB proton channel family protein [Thermoanaerobaculia bacterium]|nr:MotA/TolQ/ExbB proton channel family protein [Thermoanaerobaculia bacterium]
MTENRRITLINVGPDTPVRDWQSARTETSRMVFIESIKLLRAALRGAVEEMNLDIHRVILDCSATCEEYLDLLATLPKNCRADILLIREDGSGFLSAMGRGDDRVIYSFGPEDLRFYLEANQLVARRDVVAARTTARPAAARLPLPHQRAFATVRHVQLWTAFAHAGWVGKTVLAILLVFSLFSWATIFVVWRRFSLAERASRRFAMLFRKAKRLADVQSAASHYTRSTLVGLFRAGYAEIEAQMSHVDGKPAIRSLDSVERSLIRASRIEAARLSRFVPFLATTAAATPFIGLFGTVWGIMQSFASIAATGSTSITAVAPGIAEALINTAAGLFAAIPALLAYNAFVQRLRQARGEMEDFTLEFLNLTERNFM